MKPTQHTPEPWTRDGLRIIRNPGMGGLFNIATCADPTANQIDGILETREANAARIVACVNACSGLFDPAADLAALREALQGLVDRHAALVNSGDCGFWKVEEEPAILAARAALARTERRPA